MSSVLRLPFDQYQRYRLVSDLLDRLRAGRSKLRVLDVGGRTALLRDFLPNDEVVLVDVEPSEIRKGLVLGSGTELPFQAESFDVVCAFDTLEHVPPVGREAFVRECWRVTRSWTILAGPYDAPKVRRAENLLRRFLREKLKLRHRYLEEHREHGLPVQKDVEKQIAELGGQSCSVGHANVERWLGIMAMGMYLDHDPGLRRMAASVYEFYNKNMYMSDHTEPTYRQALVAAYNGAPLPDLEDLFDPPVPPKGAVEGLNELLRSMVAFDQERNRWVEEKSKFEDSVSTLSKDLEGHRATLGEIGADNQARKESSKSLKADLTEHKRVLREVKKQNSALQREMSRREKMRAEELKELTKLRKQIEGTQASATYHAELADTEKGMRGALEGDLKEHRRVMGELQGELKAMSSERDKLLTELTTARRHADEIGQQLGVEQKQATETISALEIDLAEHRKVMIGAQKENTALGETREGLEAELAEHRSHAEKLQHLLDEHRAESGKVLDTVKADLSGHKKLMETLKVALDARAANQTALEERASTLEAERDVLRAELDRLAADADGEGQDGDAKADARVAEIERELELREQRATSLARDLERQKQLVSELRRHEAEQGKVIEDLSADLDGHRQTVENLLVELRQARGETETA